MERKDFFSRGIPSLFRDLLETPVGGMLDRRLEGLSNLLAPQWISSGAYHREEPLLLPEEAPRPPGAVDPELFDSICTECNDCIRACPHGTLLGMEGIRGPVLDPNRNPCRLCPDYPCIKACKPKALKRLGKNAIPWFGRALLTDSKCVNSRESAGKEKPPYELCEGCVRACPVPNAVSLSMDHTPDFSDLCTGCGMCAYVCPAGAIRIQI